MWVYIDGLPTPNSNPTNLRTLGHFLTLTETKFPRPWEKSQVLAHGRMELVRIAELVMHRTQNGRGFRERLYLI